MEALAIVTAPVGIVSIAVGVFGVCIRGPLLVAPAATLRWVEGMVRSNSLTRAFFSFLLTLGATMVWAGLTEETALAAILGIVGLVAVGIAAVVVLFPGAFRVLAMSVLDSPLGGALLLWRVAGLAGLIISLLFIYFGALAL